MKFERFEEIYSWQKAKVLTVSVYKLFDVNKDYGFRDQIQRASVSIMNNIAEGFERRSNNEFRYSKRIVWLSTLYAYPGKRIK